MLILVVLGYAFLVILEFIPLFKQKIWRDFWANTLIGVFSFAIALLLALNVRIPSPSKPIAGLITSIFGK
ncbi:hypothetical protein ACHOLT_16630 [Desulfitobacterium sp. Sab5]|uniref:hypothetical protein n=1 Tax=Desulfitobacterium nosdiversum TaxID=3375356 RepID=UPI003CE78B46